MYECEQRENLAQSVRSAMCTVLRLARLKLSGRTQGSVTFTPATGLAVDLSGMGSVSIDPACAVGAPDEFVAVAVGCEVR